MSVRLSGMSRQRFAKTIRATDSKFSIDMHIDYTRTERYLAGFEVIKTIYEVEHKKTASLAF